MDLLDKLTKIISDIEEGVRSKQQIESRNAKKGVVFSPRLEELIHAALQDGVLTDHEKEVILRRAEKEGEDGQGREVSPGNLEAGSGQYHPAS